MPQDLYIAALGARLGDLVVLLPLLYQLQKQQTPFTVVVRSSIQEECLSLLAEAANCIKESEFHERGLAKQTRFHDFLTHEIIQTYCYNTPLFRRRYEPLGMNGVLAQICQEWGLPSDFSTLYPLPYKKSRSKLKNTVLFVPGATSSPKRWPKEFWLQLKAAIEKHGLQSAVLGQPHLSKAVRELIESGMTWFETSHLSEAVTIISNAHATIACDTGLMHLSVHQQKPTIVLFGNDTFWYRPYSHCLPLFSPPCKTICQQQMLKAELDSQNWTRELRSFHQNSWTGTDYLVCAVSEPAYCMSQISPEAVINCFESKVLT